jgi:hypothetical protein
MTLCNYDPLFLIRSEDDWGQFVCDVLGLQARSGLVERTREFVSGKLLPEGADQRIVQDMLECASTRSQALA